MTNRGVHRRIFKGHAAELAAVRRFAADALRHCPARDDAVLLFDELAGNAIVHTESASFEVVLRHSYEVVRGEVHDAGADQAPVLNQRPGEESESCRGLLLVDLLAEQWGTRRTSTGRLVWFELGDPGCG